MSEQAGKCGILEPDSDNTKWQYFKYTSSRWGTVSDFKELKQEDWENRKGRGIFWVKKFVEQGKNLHEIHQLTELPYERIRKIFPLCFDKQYFKQHLKFIHIHKNYFKKIDREIRVVQMAYYLNKAEIIYHSNEDDRDCNLTWFPHSSTYTPYGESITFPEEDDIKKYFEQTLEYCFRCNTKYPLIYRLYVLCTKVSYNKKDKTPEEEAEAKNAAEDVKKAMIKASKAIVHSS